MRRFAALVRAFLVRDLLIDASYKISLAVELVDVVIAVAAYYYLSTVLGDRRPAGYDAFGFLLVGMAMNNAMSTALTCFAQVVKVDQQTGAIKPVLMSSLPAPAIVALGSLYPILRSAISASTYLAAGVFFGMTYRAANIPAVLMVCGAALAAFAALGMFSAASTLVLKRGDPVLWLVATLSWLLGGVFFPVALLPPALQRAAAFLPITHALDALRATLLNGATIADVRHDVTILIAIAVIGLPLSALLVHVGTIRVKRTGTLGHS